ncbi:hypothetical protein COCC4DRAFT_204964 [Bipolaris maydis ATCC 48331]|uniref:Uncharacterized protein n=2 Tax=Cochliobolus heterostrophus TaxID=5016 RepID=M2V5K9_COCH5|nr:uncharacterized protein COCC4DRAFT_204964 [Bipolaris maydis ATCC 48331]EMD95268.1 hypothetical protein COCHEDRAFT_1168998 [Bipolaris maydis C5]KAJ5021886.1 hypothetical protein J3E73DRAFT_402494 [Bipolaris maydis]ENI00840.1 hypothetical protein COCC4DRAFT_204964 [Bipolaris maydis ATCC 48331]KAJ6214280.1 hypothetical protein PSV09DRAFT_1168998 [Bipolaris maydis]KAJ6275466.1 hypothetical protein PSV08DRAFT_357765 [Bipolaris maydis]
MLTLTVNHTVNSPIIYTIPAKRSRNRIGFQNVESGWKQLMNTFNDIELSQRFTKGHIKRIEKVTADEKTVRSGASLKQHKFLRRVLAINSDCYKLCVVAFSQNQINFTKAAILNGLVERIRERRDDINISPIPSLLDFSEDPQANNQLSKSPPEHWAELKYAERAGFEKVFGKYLLDRIKNTDMSNNWKAVVMSLPRWPADYSEPCFMSLDLREESVKEVAMALFKVEADSAVTTVNLLCWCAKPKVRL